MYGADGAYDEGASYWGYTTLHLAIFAETLWRRLGIDDRALINYPGTIRYALAFAMPTKGEGFDPTHAPRNLAVPTLKVGSHASGYAVEPTQTAGPAAMCLDPSGTVLMSHAEQATAG